MLVGYMRISKTDGAHTTDLPLDALIVEGRIRGSCTRIMPRGSRMIGPGCRPV